jgi:hypothetical protein
VLVPEKRELFASMSVADNLELGAFARRRDGDAATGARSTRSTSASRGSRTGASNSPARCRAASARCSRSAAR